LRHLFKNHGKTLKAPVRPRQKPNAPDSAKKHVLPDEFTWLWDAYDTIREALNIAIQPLYEYVETFSQFEKENKLSPEKYVKDMDEEVDGQEPVDAEELRNDIYRLR